MVILLVYIYYLGGIFINTAYWAFVANARDQIEAGMLESMLSEAGIPVLKKSKGSGAYMEVYMGISHTGIDLYVPETSLKEAVQIIEETAYIPVQSEVEGEAESIRVDIESKRRQGKRLVIWLYLAPLLLGVIYIIFSELIKLLAE